jgi:hypothetical protein
MDSAFRTGALIATFRLRSARPSRRVADERLVVVATKSRTA